MSARDKTCPECGREFYDWTGKRKYCSEYCRLQRNNKVRRLPDGYYARREAKPKRGRKKK